LYTYKTGGSHVVWNSQDIVLFHSSETVLNILSQFLFLNFLLFYVPKYTRFFTICMRYKAIYFLFQKLLNYFLVITKPYIYIYIYIYVRYSDTFYDPRGRAVYVVGLRPLACWYCGFEPCRDHWCPSLLFVVCCQVEISVSGWSLDQRSPTECVVSEYDRGALIMRRPWPTGAVAPWERY